MNIEKRLALTWAALLTLTFGGYIVGVEQNYGSKTVAAAIIIGIAMIKVLCVAHHFMDVRQAKAGLRILVEGYVVVLCAALITINFTIHP
ncbi:cytochrome C oxidase subunit IV family protein [Mycolicibacterium llatzerense]|uniref:cytochrome C oxidase subunit IV family protein n=1 Tax=Mycolicibacterium llatzerense TaxID=280871 RepID=UPI0021B4DB5C|nr:cytochrome C oxidase subunit IV family protein [Mycolicibacterium llatzerense]MCT7362760.1 hypothetical protein [Mycolicibacterium llatzerense]